MKKFSLFLISLGLISLYSCSNDDEVKPDKEVENQEKPFGYDRNEIPEDFENDLWINTDYEQLKVGQTFLLEPRRVPEIIDNPFNNKVVLPDFTFKIVRGNSVEIDSEGKVTAKRNGVSIVEISYKEKEAYEEIYGACSSVNVTYTVFRVSNDQSDIEFVPSFVTDHYSYDTYYFLDSYHLLTFTIDSESQLKYEIKCNDEKAVEIDGKYIIKLKNRANVIEIKAKQVSESINEEVQITYGYYVLDARKIDIAIKNVTHPGKTIKKQDEVNIAFKGITLPVYKLATIYNPTYKSMWDGEFTKVCYYNNILGDVESNCKLSQYDLATINDITMTVLQTGKYTFSKGYINESWWGADLGSDKKVDGQNNPNLNASITEAKFSYLPEFSFEVVE